ncbi:MAG: 30S ribosomal protein S6 [Pseudomonadota bacterium]|nr:30S ribosomal protein S6 [Magnetococcales bacterium]MEC8066992.1 30S ribosomal protein S6 [Pseudomonadota bacterium]MEC8467033.1 30S ribosomal protein S6 [Pseudomonadota bacterium]|tara:strand:- start:6115 stop:6507 length:393 start_codon:yes stop_codon:yes gene_type:complete
MAFYELVYIVRPDVASSQTESTAKKFEEVITSKGGKMIKTEQWGLKTLAYRVNKHRKGYYTMLGFEGTGAIVAEVERQMRISDDVIRFLTVNVEELTKAPSIQMAPRRRGSDDASDAPKSKRPMANTANA